MKQGASKIKTQKGETLMQKQILSIRVRIAKCLVLLLSFIFPLISAASFICKDINVSVERYNNLHELIRESDNIKKDSDLIYNLGIVSHCLGKAEEGIKHLKRAFSLGHINATRLLALYYFFNQSFVIKNNFIDNREDFNKAIYYFKKAEQMIDQTPNYPENSNDDAIFFEFNMHTSARVFVQVAAIYFDGYALAMNQLIENNDLSYNDTLTVLDNLKKEAHRCLARPALDMWEDEKEEVYNAMQVKCTALLDFEREVRPLEIERLKIEQTCEQALKDCTEHQEIENKIEQIYNKTITQFNSVRELH